MKFGKRFKAAQREGWSYLDYKSLKQSVKLIYSQPDPNSTERRAHEAAFLQEVFNGIGHLNAFFLEKERVLLSQLALHTTGEGLSEDSQTYFGEVSSLHAWVVLNYLALLKIIKKHDKQPGCPPVRKAVVQHIFEQSFYLSLEHSYLFSECKAQMREPATHPEHGPKRGTVPSDCRERSSERDRPCTECMSGSPAGRAWPPRSPL